MQYIKIAKQLQKYRILNIMEFTWKCVVDELLLVLRHYQFACQLPSKNISA